MEDDITAGFVAGSFRAFVEWNSRRSQKGRLRQMLRHPIFEWRTLSELAAAIGKDEASTTTLLVEIEARPQYGDPSKWGLISRVGPN